MLKKSKIKSLSNHPNSDWSISALNNSINSSDHASNRQVCNNIKKMSRTVNSKDDVILSPFPSNPFKDSVRMSMTYLAYMGEERPNDESETFRKDNSC